jgi:hypothetical protein
MRGTPQVNVLLGLAVCFSLLAGLRATVLLRRMHQEVTLLREENAGA